jgi:hypothetical protein
VVIELHHALITISTVFARVMYRTFTNVAKYLLLRRCGDFLQRMLDLGGDEGIVARIRHAGPVGGPSRQKSARREHDQDHGLHPATIVASRGVPHVDQQVVEYIKVDVDQWVDEPCRHLLQGYREIAHSVINNINESS